MAGSMEEFSQYNYSVVASGDPHVVYDANMLLINIYQLADVVSQFLNVTLVSSKLYSLFIICIIMYPSNFKKGGKKKKKKYEKNYFDRNRLGVAIASLLIAAATVFRPVVNTIYNNKVKTLYMFTVIPQHVVKHMAKKKISTLGGVGDSDGDADDEYMKTEKAISNMREEPQPTDKTVEHVVVRSAVELVPPRPLHEVVRTPRGSEVMRTPRGTELARTPRGDTDNQKHTLLLPNTIEEEEEGEDEPGTFKDLRNSAELRVTQGIADKILITKSEKGSPSSHKTKFEKPKKKKRHSRASSREIEMMEVTKGASKNNNNHSNNERTDEEDNEPKKVPSFREKAKLSLLPSFIPFRRASREEPSFQPLSLPLPNKSGKETDSADDEESGSDSHMIKKHKGSREKKTKSKGGREYGNRLTVSSLRGVVVKMHLSYLIAILFICVALAVSFAITYEFVGNLESIANDIKISDLRTMNVMLLITQATLYPLSPLVALGTAVGFKATLNEIWDVNNQMDPKTYQQEYMFGRDCLRINKSDCPNETYEYYDYVKYGFAHLFFTYEYLSLGSDMTNNMIANNGTISPTDPDYVMFKTIANKDLYDGLDTITFLVYADAKHQIAAAKQRIAISAVVTSVLFILIHLALFRPFVRKLRAESEHTFAILHMIPRRLLLEVPEIQEFLRAEAGEMA